MQGVSLMTMAFWNCVVGISLSHTCQQLDLNEKTVGEWFSIARRVMASDALERQSKIRFGQNGTKTIVVEADETQIFHWSEVLEEGGVQFRRHYYYVWLGVVARGDLSTLYLTPVGLTISDGEKGAVPPLKESMWAEVCSQLFNADTRAILCTDSAWAYVNYNPPTGAFVQKFHVNHTDHEYTKSVEALTDVATKQTSVLLAGTQTLDHEWSLLKRDLPRNTSCKTDEGRATLDEYWRAAQWRRLVNTSDKWSSFCQAAQRHAQQTIGELVLSSQFQELEAEVEAEAIADVDAPQELASPGAAGNSLVSMVADLNDGELASLEEAIASRRAQRPSSIASQPQAEPPMAPPTPAPFASGGACILCTPNFTCGTCSWRAGALAPARIFADLWSLC